MHLWKSSAETTTFSGKDHNLSYFFHIHTWHIKTDLMWINVEKVREDVILCEKISQLYRDFHLWTMCKLYLAAVGHNLKPNNIQLLLRLSLIWHFGHFQKIFRKVLLYNHSSSIPLSIHEGRKKTQTCFQSLSCGLFLSLSSTYRMSTLLLSCQSTPYFSI